VAGIALGIFVEWAWGILELQSFIGPLVLLMFGLIPYFIMKNSENPQNKKTMFTIILALLSLASILYAASDYMNDERVNPAQSASLILPLIAPASMLALSDWIWWKRIIAAAVFLVIYYVPIYFVLDYMNVLYYGFFISVHTVQDIGNTVGLSTTW
jgi:hypothetical protein